MRATPLPRCPRRTGSRPSARWTRSWTWRERSERRSWCNLGGVIRRSPEPGQHEHAHISAAHDRSPVSRSRQSPSLGCAPQPWAGCSRSRPRTPTIGRPLTGTHAGPSAPARIGGPPSSTSATRRTSRPTHPNPPENRLFGVERGWRRRSGGAWRSGEVGVGASKIGSDQATVRPETPTCRIVDAAWACLGAPALMRCSTPLACTCSRSPTTPVGGSW